MPVLVEASEILSTSLGSVVYHLLLLWVVVSGVGMAWGERRRARHEQTQRLLLGMAGLVLMRAVYFGAALVVAGGWADRAALLPPLERFVDAASIGLLAWAFMPPSRSGSRTWDLLLGGAQVLTLGACIAFVLLWSQTLAENPAASYNRHWQAMAWSVWQGALAIVGLVAIFRGRRQSWGLLSIALLLMLAGALSLWYLPITVPHLPIWQRMANLVAYPLVAIAVYREIVAGLHVHSRELQDISQASLDQIKSLLYLFEASQQTASSLDLSIVLDNAVRGIARVLEADQCAIAFPEEGNPGQMRLVAIHNPSRQGRGEAVSFPLEYQLTVQQAIRRKKGVVVEDSDNVQLKVLFALLGSAETGPLLVQPLLDNGANIGAIIVGNARSRRPFSANEAKLCQSLAEQLAVAIQNARRYQRAQQQIQDMGQAQAEEHKSLQQARVQIQDLTKRLAQARSETDAIQQREEAAREARNALEIKLVSSRAENEALSQRLAVLETDLAQTHANAEAQIRWHEQELIRQEAEWEEMVHAAESIQGVMQGLTAGILITDADGAVQESNVAAEILLDRNSEELHGLDLATVCDDERWQQAVITASGGEAVRLTMRMGMNTLMCDVAPLPATEGEGEDMQRLVAILQDVSVEADEQRVQLEAVASLAHELRTPVTTISSYADLLLGETVGILGEAQRKFLLQIRSGAERIVQIAGLMTSEGLAEEKWTRPQRQEVDVNQLIESAIAGTHSQLEDRDLRLTLEMQSNLPHIAADPDYLRRVLSNLLSNACLASDVGGQVDIRTARSEDSPLGQSLEVNGDGFVIVSITDSGGGLSEDALDRVFDRARPSGAPAGLGESGAGLALVKTLVEAHGGRLWVESKKGRGTTFSFVLPVANSDGAGAG
jgi:signal transduction histidine kinase/GAF domain-containing protein